MGKLRDLLRRSRRVTEDVPTARLEKNPPAPPPVLAGNVQGMGTRERQEDSFAFANALDVTEILRRGLLAVVADGMGGLKDGREVSQVCVAQVLSAFSDLDPEGDLAEQLRTWVDQANGALYDRFQGEGGTTLVTCLFLREQLWWLSVGDSYLYLLREGGLCRLNRDHNHLERLRLEAVREGRLDPETGLDDPDGPRLTSYYNIFGQESRAASPAFPPSRA